MGVFKWLRRERVTVTTRRNISPSPTDPEDLHPNSPTQIGTIRTEEYKRDLAEFQARRSSGNKELHETPVKKKCGRHSLPVSCTKCSTDPDNTFNYEKKSAIKYKKKTHKHLSNSLSPDQKVYGGVPNIQFLFQNQVFMPGNGLCAARSYSDPQKSNRNRQRQPHRSPDHSFIVQRQIDFKDDEDRTDSPPFFYKNNSLPFHVNNFLDGSRSDEEVDGLEAAGDIKVSRQSSSGTPNRDASCEDKLWEVMSELKNFDQWADEQLQVQSANTSKSEDSKSDTSAYGLPIASASDLDVTVDSNKTWCQGKWGAVPVQIKKLTGVSIEHVKKKKNIEIDILRKCRHPNIILLMGLYTDVQNNVHIICERCVDSLFGILHVQGRILSAQTSVQYALDIANALVFLRMQGYIHTELSSASIMLTARDAAKLVDLGPCEKIAKTKEYRPRGYHVYTSEPQYVNIEETNKSIDTQENEPLISRLSSETYMDTDSVAKPYACYENVENYRWQAPELFQPDEHTSVHPCSKSDVYSLCVILWECCNATLPWSTFTYEMLKKQYNIREMGVSLPQDGTYPGSLLSLLQRGLELRPKERIDLTSLQNSLQNVKSGLDEMEYIIIPARVSKRQPKTSTTVWDTNSPADSECQSPVKQDIHHKAIVHNIRASSTESSEKDYSKSDSSPVYESINRKNCDDIYSLPDKCYITDNKENRSALKYDHAPENHFSSACSTPIAKIRAKIKDIGTPGALHKSDSTEYCSILSPDTRAINFGFNDDSDKEANSTERPTAKLSRSFTPKSYKPLHIKVPEFNLDCIKCLPKDQTESGRSSYNFDIKNYSLPTTPIARSNKLRKNAWLSGSGDLSVTERSSDKITTKQVIENVQTIPETRTSFTKKDDESANNCSSKRYNVENESPETIDTEQDSVTNIKRDQAHEVQSPATDEIIRERTSSWSFKSSLENASSKHKVEEEVLANVNVRPLVAIHERWIYEANRKTGRSMSLPENNSSSQIPAMKPASHCVDILPKSLPQLNIKRANATKIFRPPNSPGTGKYGFQWEQFCQARDAVAKNINFATRGSDRFATRKKDTDKGSITDEEIHKSQLKIDQSTDTKSIEEFIRELIRKEFQHLLLHEASDEPSNSTSHRNEELLNKGVANILDSLNDEDTDLNRKDTIKSFSRVKINGNNKPLLQITFSRSGENSLQVLDNCVNVTICDANANGKDKSPEETLTADDFHVNTLKRCQAFNAIQEARSTEDLYIDDDLSTQMQENFGGKVKLIPLHGSLHEILCERQDDCCLVKVKQENGCDTIYFRCDNSDTESRDALDGCARDSLPQDTVVFKRSISLIEERIQRVVPKDKRVQTPVIAKKAAKKEVQKTRPKSEIFVQNINKESRALSNSSPSLIMKEPKHDEVELNIENVMSYQDSSSDECVKCQAENDDFEFLERKIEEDLANSNLSSSLTCGCLEKISEENLSVINEDTTDTDRSVDLDKTI